jgi:hypothetical protein
MGEDMVKEKTMTANEKQVGGSHYKNTTDMQHWDFIELYGLGYLEGYSTKYLVRWRQKGGLQDLQKAEHIVIKLLELHEKYGRTNRSPIINEEACRAWCETQKMKVEDQVAFTCICAWRKNVDLRSAILLIRELQREATARPIDKTGQNHPFGFDPNEEEGR